MYRYVYIDLLTGMSRASRLLIEKHSYTIRAIPSQDAYLRNLIKKVESVIKRMRWKANFFLKGDKNLNESYRFGIPSTKIPPAILEMKPFEDDLFNLIENIKFRNARNEFQESLANDLKKINSSQRQINYCYLLLKSSVFLPCFIIEISSTAIYQSGLKLNKMLGPANVPKLKGRNQIYIKRNKTMPVFFLYVSKPFNYFLGVSPLIYFQNFSQIRIAVVKNYFTYFSRFTFSRIN